jgi:hypothetical protein
MPADTNGVIGVDEAQDSSVSPAADPYGDLYSSAFDIDTTKGLLGTLYYADTLVLRGTYSECGEFGGHTDWLRISYSKGQAICSMVYEPPACDRRLDEEIESIQDTLVYELTRYHEKRVLEYLVQLLQLSFRYQDIQTNVMHIYTADIETRVGVPSLNRFNLLCYDLSLSWAEFRELKENIRTTANKRLPQAAIVSGDNSR